MPPTGTDEERGREEHLRRVLSTVAMRAEIIVEEIETPMDGLSPEACGKVREQALRLSREIRAALEIQE